MFFVVFVSFLHFCLSPPDTNYLFCFILFYIDYSLVFCLPSLCVYIILRCCLLYVIMLFICVCFHCFINICYYIMLLYFYFVYVFFILIDALLLYYVLLYLCVFV